MQKHEQVGHNSVTAVGQISWQFCIYGLHIAQVNQSARDAKNVAGRLLERMYVIGENRVACNLDYYQNRRVLLLFITQGDQPA